MLSEINIPDFAAPGLELNYIVPVSFDGIIYKTEFFVKNKNAILSSLTIVKMVLLLLNRKNITLLRIVLFRKKSLKPTEYIISKLIISLKLLKRMVKR